MYDISKYGLPREHTACPGCGQQYGHHNTKVDNLSQECSKCAERFDEVELITAEEFVASIM